MGEIYERKVCAKCGRDLPNTRFYKDRNSVRVDVCRDCLLEDVDVKKPSTFFPVLEKLDYPFIEELWLEQCKKQYAKDPEYFNPKNVVGVYSRVMKLGQYRDYGWADTEAAQEEYRRKMTAADEVEATKQRRREAAKRAREAEKARQEAAKQARAEARRAEKEAKEKAEKEWLEAEEARIREARLARQREIMERQAAEQADQEALEAIRQGKNFTEKGVLHDGLVGRPPVSHDRAETEKTETEKEEAPKPARRRSRPRGSTKDTVLKSKPSTAKDKMNSRTTDDFLGVLSDRQLASERAIIKKLTDDDVRRMTVKWGDTYRPSEWLRMEEMYQKYASEFELSIDREETLRQICKVSLKLDQAIDSGEYTDSSKLSVMLDSLRKSAKFTEVQNKEEKGSYVSSVGQLVAEVERLGGIIPTGTVGVDYPKDKIDITLEDNQRYLYNLVKNEGGLGNLIESYIQKLDQAKAIEAKNQAAKEEDEEDYSEYIEAQVQKEAEEMFAGFDEEVKL